jgi:hypothetical protein
MKTSLTAILFVLVASISMAQSPLPKGQAQLNAGVGLSSWGVPIYVGLDFGVTPELSLGGEVSFERYDEDWHAYHYNHSIVSISGNANYHFNKLMKIPSNWDLYAGINIGFYIWSSPGDYHGDHSSSLGLGAQVGGRYYLSKTVGLNLEFGGGNEFSGGKFGVSIKL